MKSILKGQKLNGQTHMFCAHFLLFFAIFAFVICLPIDSKANNSESEITDIEMMDYAVKVKISGPIKYEINKVDPFRILVDIKGASLGVFKDKVISGRAGITEIKTSQTLAASRLDILLQSPFEVLSEIRDGALIVLLQRDTAFSLSEKENATDKEVPDLDEDLASEITEVLFNKTDRGAELIIRGDGTMPDPSVSESSGRLIVDIPDVAMNASLPKVFAPIKSIRHRTEKGNLRFIIDLEGKPSVEFYAIDDEIVVDIAIKQKTADRATERQGDRGQEAEVKAQTPNLELPASNLISLDFQDADIVPIIRLLGEVGGYNMVVHPEVKGKITLKLLNVPWQQALDVVLKTFKLEKIVEGNIIRVSPFIEKPEKVDAEAERERFVSEVFNIKNVDISIVEKLLRDAKVLSEKGGLGIMRQYAELGKFKDPGESNISPKSTGMLIVTDTPTIISKVREIIKKIDVPEPQIYIEAKIVEVNDKFLRDFGVQWGLMWLSSNWRDSALGSVSSTPVTGGQFPVGINLPAGTTTNPATSAITFGYLNAAQTFGLDLRLSAAETVGKLKIISSPKIMTLNNEMAVIRHGAQVPIATPTQTQGVYQTSYKDAALKLKVIPQVIDDSIFLKIEVNKDEPNYAFVDINQNPRIDSRSASTQVLLKDGETIVIGGIQKTSETDNEDSVPGISKVPILGWLFKRQTKETTSEELLVFITPRIVR